MSARARLGRLVPLALAALALVAAGLVAPPSADAARPCWKRLINDWYDGRIDSTYPVKCYREAIKNLPEDVETYSSAKDDLNRALLLAISQGKGPNDPIKPGATAEPKSRPGPSGKPSAPSRNGNGNGNAKGKVVPAPQGGASTRGAGRDQGSGPFKEVIDRFGPDNADSIPIPLLVLAGLALLLLAAAAAGFVARRVQARRVRVEPGPPPGSDSRL